jgi:peptide-methionine (R)-S-oxide reductase
MRASSSSLVTPTDSKLGRWLKKAHRFGLFDKMFGRKKEEKKDEKAQAPQKT